ncbi:hypothetical protein BU23DRAFT_475803 [Bimuria novae-zelandiae CBS 107.79]|uniref:Extracellular membrane protein CFEM domain-containing protein n=1 Tax=Bimuria novae-zelandiae CBS 107.79 TaxID=1447943 RepID=A0A6A5UYS9_9PLEO|nr:hypothetical protein BU23DRAFT_475803 [Bimuria novae-zelandiae CBS 107.79]
MRFTIVLASLLFTLASAMPDPLPQGFTGPCSTKDCGVNHLDCTNRGNLCVGWPSTDPALRKGCTCSTG